MLEIVNVLTLYMAFLWLLCWIPGLVTLNNALGFWAACCVDHVSRVLSLCMVWSLSNCIFSLSHLSGKLKMLLFKKLLLVLA